MQNTDIDYANLFGGDTSQLGIVLGADPTTTTILNNIKNPVGAPLTTTQYNNALLAASQTYQQIINAVLLEANMLPPSGAMAGIITNTDNLYGVWQAPANVSIIGAASLPIKLSDSQQMNLNEDPLTGKSVNAIRFFNGQGILVWGARTLDGNSQDWRYLPVRRTLIMLEQSCKLAARAYVFQPNDKNTWEAVKSMTGSFLTSVWKEGGLQGATPVAAFSVECGLGTTMTAEDVQNGFLLVSVKVAVVHPAEFIVFTIQQQMATSG
jgi:phage tail sheath protein FI